MIEFATRSLQPTPDGAVSSAFADHVLDPAWLSSVVKPMWTQAAQYLRNLPVWWRVGIWITAFLSPTGYVLALITLSRLQVPAPPAWFIVALFCLIPLAALLVCSTVVWFWQAGGGWRVGWLVSTVLAMLLQVGVLLIIIVSAITVAISLP